MEKWSKIVYLENWFEDNPLFVRKKGIWFTNYLKKCGFISLQEYSAYEFVDHRIMFFFSRGIGEDPEKLRKKYYAAITKIQKLELYEELGLIKLLQEALTMTQEELCKAERQFRSDYYSTLATKTSDEQNMTDEITERKH